MLHLNEKWIFFDTTSGSKQHVCTATVTNFDSCSLNSPCAEVWAATPKGENFKGFMIPLHFNHARARDFLLKHLGA